MSAKTFTFHDLKDTAQAWALEQVNTKHPVQSRSETLDTLLALYEYNRFGDIIGETEDQNFVGQDPEYRED